MNSAMAASYEYTAQTLQDTIDLAGELVERLWAGAIITLDGELGAGKTTFSQAVARAIGVKGVVNSPTFTIIKEYEGRELALYHMDVYRLSFEEAEGLGLDEYFFGDGVTLVEWASLIEDLLPADRLAVSIETGEQQSRRFGLKAIGERYVALCEQLREKGLIHAS